MRSVSSPKAVPEAGAAAAAKSTSPPQLRQLAPPAAAEGQQPRQQLLRPEPLFPSRTGKDKLLQLIAFNLTGPILIRAEIKQS